MRKDKTRYQHCPKCGSENISAAEAHGSDSHQRHSEFYKCEMCGTEFWEIYKYTHTEIIAS